MARSGAVLSGLTGAGAVAVAGMSFVSVFSPPTVGILMVTAGVGGWVIGVVVGSRSIPIALRVLGSVLVALAVVTVVGLRRLDLAGVVDGAIDGPRRLLTGGLPADDDALARVPPLLLVLAGASAASLMAQLRRPMGVALAALLTFVSGVAVGLVRYEPRWEIALLFTVALLVAVGVASSLPGGRTAAGTPASRRLRPLAAAAIVLLSVAAGLVGARAVSESSEGDRFSLRSLAATNDERIQLANPLDVAAALLEGSDMTLGSVELGSPGHTHLPVATFEEYDGDTFLFAAQVHPAGSHIEGQSRSSTAVEHALTLETWPFPTVPHLGRIVEVDAPADVGRLGVEDGAGRLVALDGRSDGRWRLSSEIVGEPVEAHAPVDETVGDALSSMPKMPTDFDTIIEESRQEITGQGLTLATAEALAAQFRSSFAVVEPGAPREEQRGGHGALALECVVDGGFHADESCAGLTGSRTQVAAAFVLVSRSLGFPTRLVVGFELDPLATGPQALTAHGVEAWAEVAVEGGGWVVVDPVPDVFGEVPPEDVAGEAEDAGSSGGSEGGGSNVERDQANQEASPSVLPGARRWAFLLLPVVAAALIAAPALLRRVRMRKRKKARSAVVGAWWEMNDRLWERGDRTDPGATVTDVIDRYAPNGTVTAVSRAVNAAAFGAQETSTDDVRAAWDAVEAGERAWRSTTPRTHRMRRYFRFARSG